MHQHAIHADDQRRVQAMIPLIRASLLRRRSNVPFSETDAATILSNYHAVIRSTSTKKYLRRLEKAVTKLKEYDGEDHMELVLQLYTKLRQLEIAIV
mmetsp:Transcript_26489/g.39351  ORF Transcript_26489/g.39351 Transcript_26489/m.39351 type:complete len:97 (-) Transcript_26489:16-306(-)